MFWIIYNTYNAYNKEKSISDIHYSRVLLTLFLQGLPEYLKNHMVYYAGPAKTPAGYASGSFGPTTAG